MAQEPEGGFKVTDRRRQDVTPDSGRSSASPQAERAPNSGERSLAGLFTMLAGGALIALGAAPDPVTGRVQLELPHAADIIDVLTLLREKTEGHRSADETRVLDDIIYDLQLRYVRAKTLG